MVYKNSGEDHSLTRAGEDYLESVYRLSLQNDFGDYSVRLTDIAKQLKVSKASVNKIISMLKDAGMVTQNPYERIALTPEGKNYAAVVWRSHRALRTFLITSLGVEPEIADNEACLMEHVLSATTLEKLILYLEDNGIAISNE